MPLTPVRVRVRAADIERLLGARLPGSAPSVALAGNAIASISQMQERGPGRGSECVWGVGAQGTKTCPLLPRAASALHSPAQMLRLTASARRGVRRCKARSGNTVTYQRSTLMAVRVAHVACTETWEGREPSVCPPAWSGPFPVCALLAGPPLSSHSNTGRTCPGRVSRAHRLKGRIEGDVREEPRVVGEGGVITGRLRSPRLRPGEADAS